MVVLINERKALNKIQHSFMIKTRQTRNRGELTQLDKSIYKKSTTNITFNGERLNAFFTKIGNKVKMSYLIALS